MPRSSQIIPSYLVPHVQTYINDNSTFSEVTANPSENGTRLLCVFTSARGEDGVIKTLNNVTDYINEYGTPDFAKYGQPCYMPYAALKSGYARCHCLRVMPTDAKYSHVIICANVSIDESNPSDKKFVVKYTTEYDETGLLDKDTLPNLISNASGTSTSLYDPENGKYPLFAVCVKGRGDYGDTFKIRVVADSSMNAENEYQNYIFEVLDTYNGSLDLKESFSGSFDYRAVIGNESIVFDDLMGDPEFGSKYVNIASSYENFSLLYDKYKTFVNTELADNDITVPEFGECNLLNGKTKTGTIPNFTVDTDSDGAVGLDATIGISLKNGTNGSLDTNPETTMDNLYKAAFSGNIAIFPLSRSILSKRAVPCELILDANYSDDVKKVLIQLALSRGDAHCIIDAGIKPSISSVKDWLNSADISAISSADNAFIISKECNHKKIRDPFTNRLITVTYTYELASRLPEHYMTVGNQVPFVGSAYSTVTDFVPNSIKPIIDADDLETKEMLYTNRCNFIECISENTYVHAVQGTAQNSWSDLSEENNVAVLLEMKRKLEDFVSARIYNFAEAEDRTKFTEAADRMFTDYRQSKVRSYNVYFDMNEFEEERSILHCYLSVVFKTMAKRGIIEIDINKRV